MFPPPGRSGIYKGSALRAPDGRWSKDIHAGLSRATHEWRSRLSASAAAMCHGDGSISVSCGAIGEQQSSMGVSRASRAGRMRGLTVLSDAPGNRAFSPELRSVRGLLGQWSTPEKRFVRVSIVKMNDLPFPTSAKCRHKRKEKNQACRSSATIHKQPQETDEPA